VNNNGEGRLLLLLKKLNKSCKTRWLQPLHTVM